MRPWKAMVGLTIMIAVISSSGLAQTADADWTELRRRLAENLEMESFLAKYSNKNSIYIKPFRHKNMVTVRKSQPTAAPIKAGIDRQEVVRRAACSEGVPPDAVLAIIEYESSFDNGVRGKAGEIGASQILPATAELFELDRDKLGADYEYNIRSGMKVMKFLFDRFSEEDAIRAYNGGPAFQDSPAETRKKVESYFSSIEKLRRKYGWARCL
jgi:soluble lytic murein transglycosylase-like protein